MKQSWLAFPPKDGVGFYHSIGPSKTLHFEIVPVPAFVCFSQVLSTREHTHKVSARELWQSIPPQSLSLLKVPVNKQRGSKRPWPPTLPSHFLIKSAPLNKGRRFTFIINLNLTASKVACLPPPHLSATLLNIPNPSHWT